MSKLESFDENKIKCRRCEKYFDIDPRFYKIVDGKILRDIPSTCNFCLRIFSHEK